ncbi:hypothetical protein PGB90_008799 [Kerria lacca]
MRSICFLLTTIVLLSYVITEERENSYVSSEYIPYIGKRIKRQEQPDLTNQFFDNIFQIPISTLTAVNELIKSTRPVIRQARERIQQYHQNWQQQNNGGRPKPVGRFQE